MKATVTLRDLCVGRKRTKRLAAEGNDNARPDLRKLFAKARRATTNGSVTGFVATDPDARDNLGRLRLTQSCIGNPHLAALYAGFS